MDILERKPNARVTEVVKEIAQCWQALSKEDRMPYKEKARKGKDFAMLEVFIILQISFNIYSVIIYLFYVISIRFKI